MAAPVTSPAAKKIEFRIVYPAAMHSSGIYFKVMKAAIRDRWIVGCTIVMALAAVVSTWTYVAGRQDINTAKTDEQFNKRVDARLDSKFVLVIQQLGGISSRLDKLEGWKEGVGSDVRILKQGFNENRRQNDELRQRIDQQVALTRCRRTACFVDRR